MKKIIYTKRNYNAQLLNLNANSLFPFITKIAGCCASSTESSDHIKNVYFFTRYKKIQNFIIAKSDLRLVVPGIWIFFEHQVSFE